MIIDQRLAFIGGVDLCWGRWDNENYRLVILTIHCSKYQINPIIFSDPLFVCQCMCLNKFILFFANRLVDLGDENITKLKSSEELSNEREEFQKEETILGEKIDIQENTTEKNIVSYIIIRFFRQSI